MAIIKSLCDHNKAFSALSSTVLTVIGIKASINGILKCLVAFWDYNGHCTVSNKSFLNAMGIKLLLIYGNKIVEDVKSSSIPSTT